MTLDVEMHKEQVQIMGDAATRKQYWQAYYSAEDAGHLSLPSQFSVFIASELTSRHRVFDIGCGGGRDSILFASYGHQVVGVDGSAAAIDSCLEKSKHLSIPADFQCASISDPSLSAKLDDGSRTPVLVYARFFLHAITEEEEADFLKLARALTSSGGGAGR